VLGRLRKLRETYIARRPEALAADDSYGPDQLIYMLSLNLTDHQVQSPSGFTLLLEISGVEGRDHPALQRVARHSHIIVLSAAEGAKDAPTLAELQAAMGPERRAQIIRIGAKDDYQQALNQAISCIQKGKWE